MINKPTEVWVLIGVLVIYLVHRAKHLSWWNRVINAGISAGLAVTSGDSVANLIGGNQIYATILIMLIGQNMLDWLTIIANDREFMTETIRLWVRKKLGVADDKKQ